MPRYTKPIALTFEKLFLQNQLPISIELAVLHLFLL